MTTVTVERFKRGGSQKFYDSSTFTTNTGVWDRQALEAETKNRIRTDGFNFTMEVSDGKGAWNKYLIY